MFEGIIKLVAEVKPVSWKEGIMLGIIGLLLFVASAGATYGVVEIVKEKISKHKPKLMQSTKEIDVTINPYENSQNETDEEFEKRQELLKKIDEENMMYEDMAFLDNDFTASNS